MLRKVRFTVSSDEYILQTFLKTVSKKNYRFYNTNDNDYRSIMRLIDWDRGKPYVWRTDDYEELMNSEMLFARKFDRRVDDEIIDRIVDIM